MLSFSRSYRHLWPAVRAFGPSLARPAFKTSYNLELGSFVGPSDTRNSPNGLLFRKYSGLANFTMTKSWLTARVCLRSFNFLNKPKLRILSKSHSGLGIDFRHHQLSVSISQARFYSTSDNKSDEIYEEVADMIKSKASNILVMAGAGISTPSGIPDFRTPGTGLYDNIQKYNLPYPEAIFDIHYFMMDPRPFIALAQELYPGINYKPNIAHYFIRLLFEKQKLQKLYTQNIDGLERMAGIPEARLMEAHGTFATASCTLCGKIYPGENVKQSIIRGEIPKCREGRCKGKVKPDIVFFGENLPVQFWDYHTEVHFTDLLLVLGTSLEVYPFAGIADAVSRQTPRVLINRELVGTFGTRSNDYMLLGDLTRSVERLVKAVGWENELKGLIDDL